MDYLSSNKILIVDLETGQISEDELDDELVGSKNWWSWNYFLFI